MINARSADLANDPVPATDSKYRLSASRARAHAAPPADWVSFKGGLTGGSRPSSKLGDPSSIVHPIPSRYVADVREKPSKSTILLVSLDRQDRWKANQSLDYGSQITAYLVQVKPLRPARNSELCSHSGAYRHVGMKAYRRHAYRLKASH